MAGFSYQSLGALSAAPRLFTGIRQGIQAANLRPQDSITPEEREALELARQRAAAVVVPGQALIRRRLAQGQNAALQTAMLGSGSGSDLLATATAINANRGNAEVQLGEQQLQYNARAQAELGTALRGRAQQRRADTAVYNTQKAALTEAAARNSTDAADTVAAYGAYGLNQGKDAAAPAYGPGVSGLGYRTGYRPSLTGGLYSGRSVRYGF